MGFVSSPGGALRGPGGGHQDGAGEDAGLPRSERLACHAGVRAGQQGGPLPPPGEAAALRPVRQDPQAARRPRGGQGVQEPGVAQASQELEQPTAWCIIGH